MSANIDMGSYFANTGSGNPLSDAFSRRSAVMPFRGKQRIGADNIDGLWVDILARPSSPQKRLAYIHVPFCANHCLFCGFYRNAYATGADYTDVVIAEIGYEASSAAIRENPIHAAYLGGGTPSALSAKELSCMLSAVRTSLPLALDCEITVEGRIIHFDPEKDRCLS